MNLLKLADKQPNGADTRRPSNPFELILDYLDLGSLHALAATNRHSMQLVETYMQRRSQQQAPFIMSNEFFNYKRPQIFAKYVNNLVVYNFDWDATTLDLSDIIKKYYTSVHKLCIMYDRLEHAHHWLYPQVRHFVCNSLKGYFALKAICGKCPDLEILECKNGVGQLHYGAVPFRNLRKFIFKYSGDANLEMLMEIFQNTRTELVPIK